MLDNLTMVSGVEKPYRQLNERLNAARYRVEFMRFSFPSELQTHSGNVDEPNRGREPPPVEFVSLKAGAHLGEF